MNIFWIFLFFKINFQIF